MIEKGAREMARTKSMGSCTLLYVRWVLHNEMWNPDPNTITKDSDSVSVPKWNVESESQIKMSHCCTTLTVKLILKFNPLSILGKNSWGTIREYRGFPRVLRCQKARVQGCNSGQDRCIPLEIGSSILYNLRKTEGVRVDFLPALRN